MNSSLVRSIVPIAIAVLFVAIAPYYAYAVNDSHDALKTQALTTQAVAGGRYTDAINEVESNDDFTSANSLALKRYAYGTSSTDDVDFYVLKVPKTGQYTLSFVGDSPLSKGTWGIKVFDYDRGEVLNVAYGAGGISRSDWDVELPAGTAYIEVAGHSMTWWGDSSITMGSAYDIRLAALVKNASIAGVATKTYTGKPITPTPTVKCGSTKLKNGTDYTLSYKNNVNAGKAMVVVKGKGSYTGSISKAFTIAKAANTLKASAKSKTLTVKYSKLKKKSQTISKAKAFKVSGNKGAVTFKKTSGNKKITVSKAGKITVKKGLKKNTYKVKVKITAKGNGNYKSGTKTVAFKVRVK